jgi:hypothetical protein
MRVFEIPDLQIRRSASALFILEPISMWKSAVFIHVVLVHF